ncbi:MAG: type 1 glutamine amidotransferase [Proteobacteria bacterium]|nr:type 1 glutamine amidotransferase [Pseudomonadota bacterium]MCP4916513.1 type 1 glutamine amidotransferase [Pseudomonadota bacterium]
MPRRKYRFTLLQARNPGDRVRQEEREQFAARMHITPAQVQTVCMLEDDLSISLLSETDMLLVGGSGEYSVRDQHDGIKRAKDFLAEVADRGFPMFASCFGFQLLVDGMGGRVEKDEENAEVGSFHLELTDAGREDPVFSSLGGKFVGQLGHKDRAMVMPEGVDNLAFSELCPHQALRVHGKPVYAAQFHPELTWLDNRGRFERYMDDYGRVFGLTEAERMLNEDFFPSEAASRLLDTFLKVHFE